MSDTGALTKLRFALLYPFKFVRDRVVRGQADGSGDGPSTAKKLGYAKRKSGEGIGAGEKIVDPETGVTVETIGGHVRTSSKVSGAKGKGKSPLAQLVGLDDVERSVEEDQTPQAISDNKLGDQYNQLQASRAQLNQEIAKITQKIHAADVKCQELARERIHVLAQMKAAKAADRRLLQRRADSIGKKAMAAMREMKIVEKTLSNYEKQVLSLDTLSMRIESAHVNDMHVKGMKAARNILEAMNDTVDIDDLQDAFADIDEMQQAANEVNEQINVMSEAAQAQEFNVIGGSVDDELMKEFELMYGEESDTVVVEDEERVDSLAEIQAKPNILESLPLPPSEIPRKPVGADPVEL